LSDMIAPSASTGAKPNPASVATSASSSARTRGVGELPATSRAPSRWRSSIRRAPTVRANIQSRQTWPGAGGGGWADRVDVIESDDEPLLVRPDGLAAWRGEGSLPDALSRWFGAAR